METDELATYLGAFEDAWRVAAVLKSGRLETTQIVYFVGRDGTELGPFVRKRLSLEAGLGHAYERVLAAQCQGMRFAHLPRVFDCARTGDQLTVVMEYVRGETLGALVGRQADAAERLALVRRIFPQTCDAVSELAERFDPPIVHRDLKPSNVMVSGGDVTLIDLGIARTFKEGAEQDTAHFGTRAYAPPEQFGFGQTSVRSDVYALGTLLFFCLTGREPNAREREHELEGAGLPEALRAVIVRATRLDPAERFASARELREAAEAAFLGARGTGPEALVPMAAVPADPFSGFRRPRVGALLARVPEWAGLVWDVVVVGIVAVLVAGCVMAVVDPTPQNAAWPLWYLVMSYVCFGLAFLIAGYLVLDRRPLRREIPALARLTVSRETRLGLLAIGALLVVWALASLAAQPA